MQKYAKLKDRGNQLFKQKKFAQAIVQFQTAIDLMNQQLTHPQLHSTDHESSKLYVILHINAAFAGLNLKTRDSYEQAIALCDVALKIDPQNQKGLYRRALACKQLAQMQEKQAQSQSSELLRLYKLAKKDLEDLILLDRENQVAKQKLNQVIKNIYRVTVTQGNEEQLLSNTKTQASDSKSAENIQVKGRQANQQRGAPVGQEREKARQVRRGADMNKIMKDYKIEQVTQMARQKIEHHYLTNELPKTKAELEKALREIQKSKDVYLRFIYRMDQEYLRRMQLTFDMLFPIVEALVRGGEGQDAKKVMANIRRQKSFELLWKSFSSGEKKRFREKWVALGLLQDELK